MKLKITPNIPFEKRHNGPESGIQEMLNVIGVESLEKLIDETIPEGIRSRKSLALPKAQNEQEFLSGFKKTASKNKMFRNFIGMGYYNCYTPPVIQRNILENPGWYTAYTPYQAEIAQGRLEALINFQTVVTDLTGMEIANASLLDEGTAAAEAMAMLHAIRKGSKKNANTFLVDINVFPQTLDILKTRSKPLGITLQIQDIKNTDLSDQDIFGMFVQYPDADGMAKDHTPLFSEAKKQQISIAVATDLLATVLLKSPGEMGADVVIGNSQRFGVPLGYGGPHAAFFATREEFKRQLPGRIIGASLDAKGKNGYRMALQTREQHIRREKATSNICTAQVLLAVISGMYAVYHGANGLKNIAGRVHGLTQLLANELEKIGFPAVHNRFFDTLKIPIQNKEVIKQRAEALEI
ncbi:MAG: glycine dehydrogenase (aminomethyl-transferring), partial [Cyclobacteriaceae bacterium]|nr:glycine dehydrogenase (aminomethyl-transferring) [Cyclobacteriaceae bacterium]